MYNYNNKVPTGQTSSTVPFYKGPTTLQLQRSWGTVPTNEVDAFLVGAVLFTIHFFSLSSGHVSYIKWTGRLHVCFRIRHQV